jgi:hypothetical protein
VLLKAMEKAKGGDPTDANIPLKRNHCASPKSLPRKRMSVLSTQSLSGMPST